jgi:hypothetical protein
MPSRMTDFLCPPEFAGYSGSGKCGSISRVFNKRVWRPDIATACSSCDSGCQLNRGRGRSTRCTHTGDTSKREYDKRITRLLDVLHTSIFRARPLRTFTADPIALHSRERGTYQIRNSRGPNNRQSALYAYVINEVGKCRGYVFSVDQLNVQV